LSAVHVDGGVAQQPSLRQIDCFGNSWRRRVCRGRHVVRRVILQACGHSIALSRQRELVVISARHPTVLATPARQTRIELRLQWFIR
jgi:poly(3-hydroxybutyrate) depolymerase